MVALQRTRPVSYIDLLSDLELAAAELKIKDPAAVDGLTRERSNPELTPVLVGEYDAGPADGAKSTRADYPYFWCCHCQRPTHHKGYIITDETERRFSIGSLCGPKHYGLAGFQHAAAEFSRHRRRQIAILNVMSLREAIPSILRECDELLYSPALRAIDEKRVQFAKAAPAIWSALKGAPDGSLFVYDRERDRKAEDHREEEYDRELALFKEQSAGMQRYQTKAGLAPRLDAELIYREVKLGIGTISGLGLVHENGDLRDKVLALKAALMSGSSFWSGATEKHRTAALAGAVKAVRTAARGVIDAIAVANAWPQFFSPESLARLVRWTGDGLRSRDKLTTAGGRVIVDSYRLGTIVIEPLGPLTFPPVEAIRSMLA